MTRFATFRNDYYNRKGIALSTKTDLAKEIIGEKKPFFSNFKKFYFGNTEITEVKIESEEDCRLFEKPKGIYVTVEADSLHLPFGDFLEEATALAAQIKRFLPPKAETLLAVGIGSPHLAADSLGAQTAGLLPVGQLKKRRLCAFLPGTSGQTGLEPGELVFAAVKKLNPDCVILIDSLCGGDFGHLCKTVQLSTAGIAPGSGIESKAKAISQSTLGIPVLAIGTPTVVAFPNREKALAAPYDVDILVKRAAKLIACAVTAAFFPEIDAETAREMIG